MYAGKPCARWCVRMYGTLLQQPAQHPMDIALKTDGEKSGRPQTDLTKDSEIHTGLLHKTFHFISRRVIPRQT